MQAELCGRTCCQLRGHVRLAISSPHGNFVVQKIVEVLPISLSNFVAEELLGVGAQVANHRFGCRVVCRILEHQARAGGQATAALIEEILTQVGRLCRGQFGHHVVKSVLEHGSHRQRAAVARALRRGVLRHARHRHASYVVEQALVHCCERDRNDLAGTLLSSPGYVPVLSSTQSGSFVVRTLAQLPGEIQSRARSQLHSAMRELCASKYGRLLLIDLGLLSTDMVAEAVTDEEEAEAPAEEVDELEEDEGSGFDPVLRPASAHPRAGMGCRRRR